MNLGHPKIPLGPGALCGSRRFILKVDLCSADPSSLRKHPKALERFHVTLGETEGQGDHRPRKHLMCSRALRRPAGLLALRRPWQLAGSFTSLPDPLALCPGRLISFLGGPLPLNTSFPLCSPELLSLPSQSLPGPRHYLTVHCVSATAQND